MLYLLQQALNGVHAGALYALLAFGYALTNGVLHRTNLAYGAVFAACAQACILASLFLYDRLWIALPLALVFGAAVALLTGALTGAVLGPRVLAPLRRASPNGVVVATLGAALALSEGARLAAGTRDLWLPPVLSTPVAFAAAPGFAATLTRLQLLDVLVAALALTLATLALARSRFGRHWQALRDDPLAASLCGVDAPRAFRHAVLFGCLCAALAGVLAALHYGNVSPGTGLVFGLKILFLAAAGSYDRPPAAALGAFGFGLAETLWTAYVSLEWRDAWMFSALVALLVLTRGGWERAAPAR